jgi:hypothetical protein
MPDESQTERDAEVAMLFAVNCVLAQDKPGAREPSTPVGIFEDYAADLAREAGGDSRRLWAAAWLIASRSAGELEWPVRWRQAICGAELCRRAAEIADGSARSPVVTESLKWPQAPRD